MNPVSSSAYPPGLYATSGRGKTSTRSDEVLITSDSLKETDMQTVRELHSEWFPLTYDEDFYSSVSAGLVETEVARNREQQIIGLAIFRTRPLAQLPGCEDFPQMPRDAEVGYLMTLGVVEEWRGRGVGRRLLERVERKLHVSSGLLYLHVVVYNEAAISLYRKMGFQQISRKSEFYQIHKIYYDAITLARQLPTRPASLFSRCLNFL